MVSEFIIDSRRLDLILLLRHKVLVYIAPPGNGKSLVMRLNCADAYGTQPIILIDR